MNSHRIQLIKQTLSQIDISKIVNYQKEYPKSKTLRQIIKFSKKSFDSQEEETVSRFATKVAHQLDLICDPKKTGYVKDEKEKHYWLELSKELFKNTIGVKEKNNQINKTKT